MKHLKISVLLLTAVMLVTAATAQESPPRDGAPPMDGPQKGRFMKGREGKDHHWMQKDLTEAQISELKAFLKKVSPERLEKLEELEAKRPEMYAKVAAKGYGEMKKLEKLKEKDPAAYKIKLEGMQLEHEVRTIAREYRKNGGDKDKLKKKLQPKVDRLFDIRQEDRKMEIKHLREKVTELEKSLDERKDNKSKIVGKRIEDLLGTSDDLKW